MAARLAMRTYDCRSRTPRFLASRVSPLIAACKSFASVGKVMSLGCTVVSTVTRAKSFIRSAPLSCATRKLSARKSSSLPPRRLRQWLRSERSCGNLSHWRKRLGGKLELFLAESLRVAHESGALRTKDLARVTVDTTVQPKDITFPTDAKLLHAAIKGLTRLARKRGV